MTIAFYIVQYAEKQNIIYYTNIKYITYFNNTKVAYIF